MSAGGSLGAIAARRHFAESEPYGVLNGVCHYIKKCNCMLPLQLTHPSSITCRGVYVLADTRHLVTLAASISRVALTLFDFFQ